MNLLCIDLSVHSDAAFPISYNDLLLLSSIREIDGYLRIEQLDNAEITDLRFLRGLEVIRGVESVLFFIWDFSLIIQDNPHLRTLNLASLRRVENGGLRIVRNTELCLVDTISFRNYVVDSSARATTGGHGQDCSGESHVTMSIGNRNFCDSLKHKMYNYFMHFYSTYYQPIYQDMNFILPSTL